MKKKKILIRLMMLIFIIAFPVYQVYSLGMECLRIREANRERSTRITNRFRENFLMRREDFYADREYQREFKELENSKR